ncbi:hypothetical protein CLV51_102401 [Chitinophaga niastensis]|uniref:Uncharacterized protein n=1 Tax=Chitinophaga niastensis TaxID=536980 RepID=A0A2P8HMW1_CHINA|nr:hypothetical protein [Chitinophaga niastensis]PSL47544.1 hypothetical protein CLV51_102401 [Chitinophaga niastensis]
MTKQTIDSNAEIDKKALKILLSYNLLKPNETSPEDFEYAQKTGLMFDPIAQTHDEAVKQLFKEFKASFKKKATDLFLASLSSNHLEWRAGLPVFAIMQTMPEHSFTPASPELLNQCAICTGPAKKKVDLSWINVVRFLCGGIIGTDVYDYAFIMKQHNLLPDIKPIQKDFDIFSAILELFVNAADTDTPTKMLKSLRSVKDFKSTEEQRRVFIDTLGYCSILETAAHKGFLHKYTNLGVTPRKSRSSDWHYPVDWWEGKDGINRESLKFWFGDYPDLKKFFK